MFAQIIFGWPFIILSLLLAAAGILTKRPALLVASAIFFGPPAWFIRGYPFIGWIGLFLPVFILGAAYFVKKDRRVLAWLLILPLTVVSAWLAFLVMAQNRNLSGG
jgi:hypothetical protein